MTLRVWRSCPRSAEKEPEIEELLGASGLVTSMPAHAAFAAGGALLFGSGIVAQKLLNGALKDSFAIYPQPWPPGIQISGSFRAL